jgi:hypothetical protein
VGIAYPKAVKFDTVYFAERQIAWLFQSRRIDEENRYGHEIGNIDQSHCKNHCILCYT